MARYEARINADGLIEGQRYDLHPLEVGEWQGFIDNGWLIPVDEPGVVDDYVSPDDVPDGGAQVDVVVLDDPEVE